MDPQPFSGIRHISHCGYWSSLAPSGGLALSCYGVARKCMASFELAISFWFIGHGHLCDRGAADRTMDACTLASRAAVSRALRHCTFCGGAMWTLVSLWLMWSAARCRPCDGLGYSLSDDVAQLVAANPSSDFINFGDLAFE
mgnify:CR=1 FL=1